MNHFTLSIPLILYLFSFLKKNQDKLNFYIKAPCSHLGSFEPLTFLFTFLFMHLAGFSSLHEFQQSFQIISISLPPHILIFSSSRIKDILLSFTSSMLTYKLLLFQRFLIHSHAKELLSSNKFNDLNVLDLDGYSVVSFSHKREGSLRGHHRRYPGKPTLQASLSFIGNVFVDLKLFPGNTNSATFFKKAVNRAISIGYKFDVVRADTAYGHLKNLLFLEKLSLHYCMGIRTNLLSIKEGIKTFKKLAREGSATIICIGKGSHIFDLGLVNIATNSNKPCYRRVILCRRIHRRKNRKGKWKVTEYYYAIVTNLNGTPRKIFSFYHQRQGIENGLKTLTHHFSFSKLHSQSLRVNEFWMVTKILTDTLVKVFSLKELGRRYVSMRLKTMRREIFGKTLHFIKGKEVHLLPKPRYLWHLKRIFAKMEEIDFQWISFKTVA